MGEDELPPIAVVETGYDDERPAADGDMHRTVRTVAAVVGAAALVWTGWSVAGLRADSEYSRCRSEVDTTRYALEEASYRRNDTTRNGRPELDRSDADALVDQARGCGLDTYADLLEELYAAEPDD